MLTIGWHEEGFYSHTEVQFSFEDLEDQRELQEQIFAVLVGYA
jgi:hypothetical protein